MACGHAWQGGEKGEELIPCGTGLPCAPASDVPLTMWIYELTFQGGELNFQNQEWDAQLQTASFSKR